MPIEYLTVEHLSTKDLIRIFSKIEIHPDVSFNGTPCWIWHAAHDRDGYGVTGWRNHQQRIHRLLFAWLIQSIPTGNKHGEMDHLCRRRACGNPLHLELVPTRLNVLRGNGKGAINARKTHCIRGHQLTGRNLITRRGMRQCATCIKYLRGLNREATNARERERYKLKKLLSNGDSLLAWPRPLLR